MRHYTSHITLQKTMPLIKSAKKKLRQAKKRQAQNLIYKRKYKQALKEAKKNPTKKNIAKAYSLLDKAAKKNVIHKNKAGRLKSQIFHASQS